MNWVLKRILLICSILFILLSAHIWYLYINEVSDKVATKGWTVVEWVLQSLNYLPYTSNKKTDKFYQSLVFAGCKKYAFTGGKITIENDLCDIYTNNDKTYYITIVKDLKWIDDVPFTIEDVLFTYQEILKNNQRSIPTLDSFTKIDIAKIEDNKIKVEFPNASTDNQWFFANPILPKHVLENKNLSYYTDIFATQPIYISCAVLDLVRSQNNNIVFDLSQCSELLPKLLQVKKFDNKDALDIYARSPGSIMDFTADGQELEWYSSYQLSTNTIYTLFFNTTSIPEPYRTLLGTYFSTINYTGIQLSELYKIFSMPGGYDKDKLINFFKNKSTIVANMDDSNKIPFLPSNIRLAGKNKLREYYIDPIADVYSVHFNFDYPYDKIGVSANSGDQYFPDTYDVSARSTDFNLSPKYNNIISWKNTYIIYGYEKWQSSQIATITIHHGIRPTTRPQNIAPTYMRYNFLYLSTTGSAQDTVIEQIRSHLATLDSAKHINFIPVYTTKELEKKIQSKDYDFILLPIDLGNKSDLSVLFSDNTLVNPSLYINKNLWTKVQQYFWWTTNLKWEIVWIYNKLTPFVMLGSPYKTLLVKDEYSLDFDDLDLSNFRYYIINSLGKYEKVDLDKGKIINRSNFVKFINKKINNTNLSNNDNNLADAILLDLTGDGSSTSSQMKSGSLKRMIKISTWTAIWSWSLGSWSND